MKNYRTREVAKLLNTDSKTISQLISKYNIEIKSKNDNGQERIFNINEIINIIEAYSRNTNNNSININKMKYFISKLINELCKHSNELSVIENKKFHEFKKLSSITNNLWGNNYPYELNGKRLWDYFYYKDSKHNTIEIPLSESLNNLLVNINSHLEYSKIIEKNIHLDNLKILERLLKSYLKKPLKFIDIKNIINNENQYIELKQSDEIVYENNLSKIPNGYDNFIVLGLEIKVKFLKDKKYRTSLIITISKNSDEVDYEKTKINLQKFNFDKFTSEHIE